MHGKLWKQWTEHVKRVGPSWLFAAITLSHMFCCRISEILSLQANDFNWRHRFVRIKPLKRQPEAACWSKRLLLLSSMLLLWTLWLLLCCWLFLFFIVVCCCLLVVLYSLLLLLLWLWLLLLLLYFVGAMVYVFLVTLKYVYVCLHPAQVKKCILSAVLPRLQTLKQRGVKVTRKRQYGARGYQKVVDTWLWPQTPDGFVFPSVHGGHMKKDAACHSIVKARKKNWMLTGWYSQSAVTQWPAPYDKWFEIVLYPNGRWYDVCPHEG